MCIFCPETIQHNVRRFSGRLDPLCNLMFQDFQDAENIEEIVARGDAGFAHGILLALHGFG